MTNHRNNESNTNNENTKSNRKSSRKNRKKKEIEKLMNVKNVKCKMKWILRIWRTLQKMFWTKSLWKACEFTLWVLKRWRWRCIKMSKTVFVERSGNIGKRHEDMFLTHFLMFLTFLSYLPIYLSTYTYLLWRSMLRCVQRGKTWWVAAWASDASSASATGLTGPRVVPSETEKVKQKYHIYFGISLY